MNIFNRILLSICVLLSICSKEGYSQTVYHPMLKNLEWISQHNTFGASYFFPTSPSGDTLITSNNYAQYGEGSYSVLLREDSIGRKVFRWNSNTNTDELFYDFTVDVGDSVPFGIVVGKDSMLLNVGWRTRWMVNYTNPFNNNVTYYIVESIGSIYDPLSVYPTATVDGYSVGQCFYQNNQLILSLSDYNCPMNMMSIGVMIKDDKCLECSGAITALHPHPNSLSFYSLSYTGSSNASGYESIMGLCASTGTVTLSNQNTGVFLADVITIANNGLSLQANATLSNPTCDTCCDGSIEVNVNSGNPPYNFQWNPIVGVGSAAIDLCSGSYVVCVRDSLGCGICESHQLNSPIGFSESITQKDVIKVSSNGTLTLVKENINGYIELSDLLGKIVLKEHIDNHNRQIDFHQTGVYLYKFQLDNGDCIMGKWLILGN